MTGFLITHHAEIQKILAKYPKGQERSAVMPLLHLAQIEKGHIGRHDIEEEIAPDEAQQRLLASIDAWLAATFGTREGTGA